MTTTGGCNCGSWIGRRKGTDLPSVRTLSKRIRHPERRRAEKFVSPISAPEPESKAPDPFAVRSPQRRRDAFLRGQTAALRLGNQQQPASLEGSFSTHQHASAKRSWVLRLRLGLPLGRDEFQGSPPLRMTMLLILPYQSARYHRRPLHPSEPDHLINPLQNLRRKLTLGRHGMEVLGQLRDLRSPQDNRADIGILQAPGDGKNRQA